MRSPANCVTLLSVAGMLAASQCWSQESMVLGKGAAGESLSVSVLETKGATRKVQVRLTYAAAQTIATMPNIVASESTEQIDCQKGTYSVIHYALFSSLVQGATPIWTKEIDSADVNLPLFDVPLSHAIMRPSIAVPRASVLQIA